MIFKRKIYNQLLQWKDNNEKKPSNGKKAVLIEGARRIGKSTIAEEFAKNEYKSYLLIDFSEPESPFKEYFDKNISNIDYLLDNISSVTKQKVTLYPNESIIIFDEIQDYPAARKYLDIFVKDGRYDYIETGSLISAKKKAADIKLPTMEHSINMYPLDFEEFCWALGEDKIVADIRQKFSNQKKLDEDSHRKAMRLFREYMLIGGMPQPLVAFINNGKDTTNLKSVDDEKRDILKLYRDDLDKIPSSNPDRLIATFDDIPGQLSRHEQKTELYGDAYTRLADTMICNVCYMCTDPHTDLNSYKYSTYAKCYMGDMGLLLSLKFTATAILKNDLYGKILSDNLHINEGMSYENVISQMLVSAGHEDLFFFSRQGTDGTGSHNMEIEFLIARYEKQNYRVCPIEVKSETGYESKSLHRFKSEFGTKIGTGYVILPANLHYDKDNDIMYIPPYMTFCL